MQGFREPTSSSWRLLQGYTQRPISLTLRSRQEAGCEVVQRVAGTSVRCDAALESAGRKVERCVVEDICQTVVRWQMLVTNAGGIETAEVLVDQ